MAKKSADKIRIALTKGRLEKESVKLFEKIGWDVSIFGDKGRKLIFEIPALDNISVEIVLAKAPDVVTYVEYGVCDLGITGKDMLMEHGSRHYEVADLNLGKCRFALAVKAGDDFYKGLSVKTVASKYVNVARNYFENKGMDVDIVKIEGSVELAPLLSLADGIVDLVETGATLKENGLEVYEYIADVSARLIANETAMKLKQEAMGKIIDLIESVIEND